MDTSVQVTGYEMGVGLDKLHPYNKYSSGSARGSDDNWHSGIENKQKRLLQRMTNITFENEL